MNTKPILMTVIITLVLTVSIAGAISTRSSKPNTENILFTVLERIKEHGPKTFNWLTTRCRSDSNCRIATLTCCPCSLGGTQVAVNRFGLLYYTLWRQYNCQGMIKCEAVYSCWATEAVCEQHRCILKT